MGPNPFEVIFRKEINHLKEGKHPGFGYKVESDAGMRIERDVPVPMRDGTKIYVDILRPEGVRSNLPVIVTYSPYGKHAHKNASMFPGSDIPPGTPSKYAVWEGPDPIYWTSHGYAVINADTRGSWYSEGDLTIWSHQEAEDGYDLIEWAAAQPWCSGKVGMSGVSYLAIVQWGIASLNPPHLAAFNPWEGWSDPYRERFYHGGMPETKFVLFGQWSTSFTLTRSEDMVQSAAEHPLLDEFWKSKTPELSKITAPAFVVADWGDQGLHTRGTLEGFKQCSSKHKWLEVHGRKKWPYYYRPESVERLRTFFDHFLKGTSDEVLSWPKVQIEIRDRYLEGQVRTENEWPLARTNYVPLYLDAASGSLQPDQPKAKAEVRYDPLDENQRAQFDITFTRTTELTGHFKLKLWIQAAGSEDADLFVALQKFDQSGAYVPFPFFSKFNNGPMALGWLRVSHRELDPVRSRPEQPWHTHQREDMLKKGEIVPVEIELWASSTLFHEGEKLRLFVQGTDVYKYPNIRQSPMHERTRNKGQHVIYSGAQYDSHLLVPMIPNA